jgi:signal peptidase I
MTDPQPAEPVPPPSHAPDPRARPGAPDAGAPPDQAVRARFTWLPPAPSPTEPDAAAPVPAEAEPAPAETGAPADRGEQLFIDAWDEAERTERPHPTERRQRSGLLLARELVETAILALVIFMGVRGLVQNFRVEGASMDPTYATGQYVLVNKALYARVNLKALGRVVPFIDSDETAHYVFRGPRRGEVIVFHPPAPNSYDRDFIKRVIGLPGEHVQVKDGRVYINGQELSEPYVRVAQTFCGGQQCDVQLGPDEYYVMGDNRANSSDSRLWGPVPGRNIIGKAWLIYLPIGDFGPAPNQSPRIVSASAAPPTGPEGGR